MVLRQYPPLGPGNGFGRAWTALMLFFVCAYAPTAEESKPGQELWETITKELETKNDGFEALYSLLPKLETALTAHPEWAAPEEDVRAVKEILEINHEVCVLRCGSRWVAWVNRGHPAADGWSKIVALDAEAPGILWTLDSGGGQQPQHFQIEDKKGEWRAYKPGFSAQIAIVDGPIEGQPLDIRFAVELKDPASPESPLLISPFLLKGLMAAPMSRRPRTRARRM